MPYIANRSYFVVVHEAASTLVKTQVEDVTVSYAGGVPGVKPWRFSGAEMTDSVGAFTVPNGAPSYYAQHLFRIAAIADPSDPDNSSLNPDNTDLTTELRIDPRAMSALPAGLRSKVIDALLMGSDIVFTGANTAETMTLKIGSLRTTDYLMDGQSLVPAYPGAITGTENVTLPSGYGALSVGLNASTLTPVAGTGTMALAPTDAAPPEATNEYDLTLTGATDGMTSTLSCNVFVPTQLVVLLDRSGSMGSIADGTETKWDIATNVASLFSHLYGNLLPDRKIGTTTTDLADSFTISISDFDSTEIAIAPFVDAATTPAAPAKSPGAATPVGEALSDAAAAFDSSSGGRWRRRQVLLLTDGMDNTGDPRLAELAQPSDYASFPLLENQTVDGNSLTGDLGTGIILHNVSYAITGNTPDALLDDLVEAHNGTYDNTGTSANPADPGEYREAFLDRLGAVIPAEDAEIVESSGSYEFSAEPGLEKMIVVASKQPSSGDIGIEEFDGSSWSTVGGTTADTNYGFSWVALPSPDDTAQYRVSNVPAGAKVYRFYDLSIRTKFGADVGGAGEPLKLWAEVKYEGRPVSGVDVRVAVASPAESEGQLLSGFARKGGLVTAYQRKTLSPAAVAAALNAAKVVGTAKVKTKVGAAALSATPAAAAAAAVPIDIRAIRAQLHQAAAAARNLPFQYEWSSVSLAEVAPGRYEATVPAEKSANEGIYTMKFRADGRVDGSKSFARNCRFSRVLKRIPSAETSDTTLVNTAAPGVPGKWVATVVPKDASGVPLGPGLGGRVAFQYLDPADRQSKELPTLDTVDNLDGSYSVALSLPEGKLPKFGLFYGSPEGGICIPVKARCGQVTRVRVRLDKIQILDDKDPAWLGKGELAFVAQVGPNASPSRTVRTRLPEQGVFSAGSGEEIEIGKVIYDGFVEKGAVLAISITGKELDWPRCFDKSDRLARYVRRLAVPQQTTRFVPGDEARDPEVLADWLLWYTVEVE